MGGVEEGGGGALIVIAIRRENSGKRWKVSVAHRRLTFGLTTLAGGAVHANTRAHLIHNKLET